MARLSSNGPVGGGAASYSQFQLTNKQAQLCLYEPSYLKSIQPLFSALPSPGQ